MVDPKRERYVLLPRPPTLIIESQTIISFITGLQRPQHRMIKTSRRRGRKKRKKKKKKKRIHSVILRGPKPQNYRDAKTIGATGRKRTERDEERKTVHECERQCQLISQLGR
jgi:hypothetical protein